MSQPSPAPAATVGIIIVDHGSRSSQSNTRLIEVVESFAATSPFAIVEPAHMDLAEPSIATAFDRCVKRGASLVVIQPYFLSPGRHWQRDLPQLAAAAAQHHDGVLYRLGEPLGGHPLLTQVIEERIRDCLAEPGDRKKEETTDSTINL